MNKEEMLKLAGLHEEFDPRTSSRIVKTIENAMVDLEDEILSMEGEERKVALQSLQQASAGINSIKQLLSKYTAF